MDELEFRRNAKTTLSNRQEQILRAIASLQKTLGFGPNLREIGEAVGLAAVSSVKYQIDELEKAGCVRKAETVPAPSNWSSCPKAGSDEAPASDFENSPARDGMNFIPLVGQIAAGIPITSRSKRSKSIIRLLKPSPAKATCSC
jgi:repressor LexA